MSQREESIIQTRAWPQQQYVKPCIYNLSGADSAQSPPLYLHVTSTTKEGLEQAIKKIEELMQQELPNLVDERRFRRREPEQVERDELGRVKKAARNIAGMKLTVHRESGRRRRFPLVSNPFPASIFVRRSSVHKVLT